MLLGVGGVEPILRSESYRSEHGGRWIMSNMKKPRLSIPILPAVLMVLLASGGLFVSPTAAEAQQGGSDLMEVTFAEDVAPILYETCVVCHRPGSIAPMSLLDYETARQYAPLIKWRVENRKMPPWFIDKHAGIQEFKDDRSLSDAEITTIASWVDQGALPGDLASLPPVPVFEDEIYEWTLQDELGREPDLIVPIPEPFTVPADGPNMWMEFVSESGLTEDRWIKAYETKPSLEGFPVVHHAGTSLMFPDGSTQGFSEYALGKTGDIFPPNTGRLIKAGTKMRWNVHYSGNPNGEDTTDRTRIALWFYPKGEEPKWEHIRRGLGNISDLDIPPGAENVRHEGYNVLKENIRLVIFQPHMHNLGSRQCMNVIYPDGRKQTLNCASWDFGWHIAYNYQDEVQPLIPKGSVIQIVSWHNNSESNPWAADPRNWVGWGNRSTDDMAFAHISFYELSDEEFEQQLQERLSDRDRMRRTAGLQDNDD